MEGIFHVHSNYSSDGRLSLEELKEECIKRGLSFMVLTDHAEDFQPGGVMEFINHCRQISDNHFWAIPGLEFNIDKDHEVHLLVVGLEGLPCENGSEAILKRVRETKNNTLAVVAHLSRSNHYIPSEYENIINGIEIWNAAYDSRYLPDHKAIRLFNDLKKRNEGLVGFGGLDLHDRSGFRDLKLRINRHCTTESELLTHLKAGRFTIKGPHIVIASIPDWGFLKIILLNIGRKLLTVSNFIKWKLSPPQ